MTGKKRQRYDFLPRYASLAFDLRFQFIGDFGSGTPMRPELEGSREKKSFIVRYYSGDKLRAALLCNQKDEKFAEIEGVIRAAHGKE